MRWQANLGLAFTLTIFSVASNTGKSAPAASLAPDELVGRTVANEMRPDNSAYMFRDRKEAHGSQTKLMVETRDAMAGLLVAIDDHPLTQEQRNAENARVDRFAKDPEELNKRKKQEKDDRDRTERIVRALPDAFLYEYDGNEIGRAGLGTPGATLTRLKFRPNPKYNPPTHVEQVLVGMQGSLLIDQAQCRIARIDGTLVSEVSFGWGILGHLDKGGHFLVEQADVGDGHWEITHMAVDFTGKVLLFKSIVIRYKEFESDFKAVPPDLTFAQGLAMLRKQEATLAQNETRPKQ